MVFQYLIRLNVIIVSVHFTRHFTFALDFFYFFFLIL